MDFNHTVLMGRLAADPIYKPGKKGDGSDNRCWARLAVKRHVPQDKADYFPICAWGKRAEVLANYGKKGKVVLVRGSLRTDNKLRTDGKYDNYTEVSVAEIILGPDPTKKSFTPEDFANLLKQMEGMV